MPNTSSSFSVATNDSSVGSVAWTVPASALVNDARYSEFISTGEPTISNYLKVTLPNHLTFSSSLSVITGIEITVERKANINTTSEFIKDYAVYVLKNGTIVSDNLKKTAKWSTTETTVTYGGPTELFNTTWYYYELGDLEGGYQQDNSQIGFIIAAQSADLGSGIKGQIDNIRVRVYTTV